MSRGTEVEIMKAELEERGFTLRVSKPVGLAAPGTMPIIDADPFCVPLADDHRDTWLWRLRRQP